MIGRYENESITGLVTDQWALLVKSKDTSLFCSLCSQLVRFVLPLLVPCLQIYPMALETEHHKEVKDETKEGRVDVGARGDGKDRGRDKNNPAPPSKVVIRRLPPTMTKTHFMEHVSPMPDYDYLNYVPADFSLGQNAFCTAYVNFSNQEDIFIFKDKFDGYVFLDSKGNEFPAVVEFAPFQKIPKGRNRKDIKCGTIEQDPDYEIFLEALQNPSEVSLPGIETYLEEIETKERELKANHGIPLVKTPLLEYVHQRKLEKQRIREEKREERRRRELERRKQREEERRKRKLEREKRMSAKSIKEKSAADSESKTDNSDSEAVVMVLKNPERKASSKSSAMPQQPRKSEKYAEQNEVSSGESQKNKPFKKKHEKPTFRDDDRYSKNNFSKTDVAKSDSGRKVKDRFASSSPKDTKIAINDKGKTKQGKTGIKDDSSKKLSSVVKDETTDNDNATESLTGAEEGRQKATKSGKTQRGSKVCSSESNKQKDRSNNNDEVGAKAKIKNDNRIRNKACMF